MTAFVREGHDGKGAENLVQRKVNNWIPSQKCPYDGPKASYLTSYMTFPTELLHPINDQCQVFLIHLHMPLFFQMQHTTEIKMNLRHIGNTLQ